VAEIACSDSEDYKGAVDLANELIHDNDEILRMLGTMIRRIRNKKTGDSNRETLAEKDNQA